MDEYREGRAESGRRQEAAGSLWPEMAEEERDAREVEEGEAAARRGAMAGPLLSLSLCSLGLSRCVGGRALWQGEELWSRADKGAVAVSQWREEDPYPSISTSSFEPPPEEKEEEEEESRHFQSCQMPKLRYILLPTDDSSD
jgi:hypothetical protein